MPMPPRLRRPLALLLTAPGGLAACVGEDVGIGGAGGAAPAGAAAKPVRTAPPRNAAERAMSMRQGFCCVDSGGAGAAADGRRVELVVGGDAAARATSVRVVARRASTPGRAADLAAGDDGWVLCAGAGRSVVIGGAAMTGGEPALTVTSDGRVAVLARTAEGRTLAAPAEVGPSGAPAALAWGAAAR
jgi:hypothetical protein